ncbi:MAG: hypothetical protein ABR592_06910 [Nitriliruptorales bacterium]
MTTLFIVDDIHYLNLATREGQAVNDHLKYLANTVAATFCDGSHKLAPQVHALAAG